MTECTNNYVCSPFQSVMYHFLSTFLSKITAQVYNSSDTNKNNHILIITEGAVLAQCQNTRLPPMWPRFDSRTRRLKWAEFVGSLLCSERFFSGYSGFPLSLKTNLI